MDTPVIAGKKPIVMDLAPGVYYWCSCGLSKSQPFCDGSHKATAFKPMEFKVEESGKKALCPCKQTKTPPFCDGEHKKLP